MKKMFVPVLLASICWVSSCVPEIPEITPATSKGNFHSSFSEMSGTTGYYDCSNNELILNDGDLLVDYNVVVNSNVINANAHLLLNNLSFTTNNPNVSYHGNFDMKLNAHAAKGEVLKFTTSLKLQGKGTSNNLSASLDIFVVYNANGTLTVQKMNLTPGCN